MVRTSSTQSIPAAMGSSLPRAGLPTWRAYCLEIPAEWQVLRPLFVQASDRPDAESGRDILAELNRAPLFLEAALLLHRSGTFRREALQEFEADPDWEAALLDRSGRCLRPAGEAKSYGVLRLAEANPSRMDQGSRGECLVLVPSVSTPADSTPDFRVFVGGSQVYPAVT